MEALEKNGELTLEQIAKLIPIKHKDHRDFYILASLITLGLIDDDLLKNKDNDNSNKYKAQLLARKYFACSTADKTATYENYSWSIFDGSLKDQTFALSGKGSLFLSEFRTKRVDRFISILSGVIIGTLVALIGTYLKNRLSLNFLSNKSTFT